MSFTKSDLANNLSLNTGLSKRKSKQFIETVLETMKSTLESGEDVMISRFGKFYLVDKRKRRGRNPETGKVLILDARRIVLFRSSPILKERINVGSGSVEG